MSGGGNRNNFLAKMRIIITYLFLCLLSSNLLSQEKQYLKKDEGSKWYEWAIEMSSSLPVGKNYSNIFALETIQGYSEPDKSFFVGIGVGIRNFAYNPISKFESTEGFTPVIKYQSQYSFSVFVQMDLRLPHIRKLKKKFIPGVSFRMLEMIHPWHKNDIIKGLPLINNELSNYEFQFPAHVIEISVGGEFVINKFPRLYVMACFSHVLLTQGFGNEYKTNYEGNEVNQKFYIETSVPNGLALKTGIRF